ncbi:CRISPR-associated helicase Cas3' [Heyndrickxia coagulans]|uniref:CRISPR-associated helicase Cas3' n=1 Tax=Heyndrickxia coagulans TaxID=1398 RepID=UPI002E242D92|nr:CRISPR-associated helicase Cas3' [Heyndrickxia coagulans]MED4936334.1 CRISPR-associated helicase Cas3' [Heyndrickxia coagulans]
MRRIREYIDAAPPILAHIGGAKPETLEEHSKLVMDFVHLLEEENGLKEAVERCINALRFKGESLPETLQSLVTEWFYQGIYLHDLGKINPAFQSKKMKNEQVDIQKKEMDSKHSLLSSLLFLDIFYSEIEEKVPRNYQAFMAHVLYCFTYMISRHHTYLENVSDDKYFDALEELCSRVQRHPYYIQFYREAKKFAEFELTGVEDYQREQDSHEPFSFYILMKLFYSALVACDFYATYTYNVGGQKPGFRFLTEHHIKDLRKTYEDTEVLKGIRRFQQDPSSFDDIPINSLRSQIFLEAETQLLNRLDKNIFYLESPTGSGKTNMSINLALVLLESGQSLNKIIYVFPFNTLVEQTKASLDQIFPDDFQTKVPIKVVNSVTPIITKEDKRNHGEKPIDLKEEVLMRQMLQYPITVTSHVNFFNYLFGQGRESNLPFVHLCNSVVILDEIQSYRNDRWIEIIHFLESLSELLNMKIIIMSATLPKLDRLLLHGKEVAAELLPNARKYYENPIFKDRVHVHFELLEKGTMDLDELEEFLDQLIIEKGPKRILFEFVTKRSAREFHRRILEKYEKKRPVILLTGDDHSYYRKKVIEAINKKEEGVFQLQDVILIATQVVEAGVDIDMDIGFKNISTLDSDEQMLGRINRSCLREDCHAYFFLLDDVSKKLKNSNDYRLEKDLRDREYQNDLINKDFHRFYQNVFRRLIETSQERNNHNIEHFLYMVQSLNFGGVADQMKLIEQQTNTLFIAYLLELDNQKKVDGREIWNQYKSVLKDSQLDYAERQVKLSELRQIMDYFTFNIFGEPVINDDQLGNLYFVEKGELYMEIDPFTHMQRFNPQKYQKTSEDIFI